MVDNKSQSASDLPRFIVDKPQGIDELQSKSQEQLAQIIATGICDRNEASKIIGIEGQWGSGKSNVIEIVRNKLNKTHHTFVYDAWGHQEDSHRRTFLEELTLFLTKGEFLKEGSGLEEKLRGLLSRKKETQIKNVPKLSKGIISVGIIFLLTPILIQVSNALDISSSTTDASSNTPGISWIWKLIISLAPVILGLLYCPIHNLFSLGLKNVKRIKFTELFWLYRDRELETVTDEVIYEEEPSVREFKSWMEKISSNIKKEEEGVLIVFDNMDRLPPDKVRGVWSSIHTFFSENHYEKIWLIVTFDRDHLRKAFRNADHKEQQGNQEEQPEGADDVADRFLDKTFSIIYRIPPPILTDWRDYFDKKFKEAFGENTEEYNANDLFVAKQVFDRLQPKITPRNVIVFLNELVGLKQLCREEIPLPYLALFALKKRDILADPQKVILQGAYLEKAETLFRDKTELAKYITVLAYNVPLDSAMQVLLSRDISRALQQKDRINIDTLAQYTVFVEILKDSIQKEYFEHPVLEIPKKETRKVSSDQPKETFEWTFTDAISVLDTLNTSRIEKSSVPRLQEMWDRFIEIIQAEQKLPRQEFEDMYAILIKRVSEEKRNGFIKYLIQKFQSFPESQFGGQFYYRSLSLLAKCLIDNKIDIKLDDHLSPVRLEPSDFLPYLSEAGEKWKKYKVDVNWPELDTYIISIMPSYLTLKPTQPIHSLHLINTHCDFSETKKFIESKIRECENGKIQIETGNGDFFNFEDEEAARVLHSMLSVYRAVSKKRPLEQKLSTLATANLLQALSNNSDNNSHAFCELLAIAISYKQSNTNLNNIMSSLKQISDSKTIKEVARYIECYIDYGSLLLLVLQWNSPLITTLAKELISSNSGHIMNIEDILPHFFNITQTIGVSENEFYEHLNGRAESLYIESSNLIDLVPNYDLYRHTTTIDNYLSEEINTAATEYLKSESKDNIEGGWGNKDSYYFNALNIFIENRKIRKLPQVASEAKKNILSKIAKGEEEVPAEDSKRYTFLVTPDAISLKGTIKDIRDIFIDRGATEPITPQQFLLFREFLETQGDLDQRSGDVSRTILSKIIKDEKCREKIIEGDFYVPIILAADDEAEEFKQYIQQLLQENPNDTKLQKFATPN